MGDRAHHPLVAPAEVGVDHVEVALVDRHVDGLAHRATRVVQPRRAVGELHEVLEIDHRAIAATAFEIAHERRPVGRREDDGVATDRHRPLRVAGVLHELSRRGRAEVAGETGLEAHAVAVDLRSRVTEQRTRHLVAADVHADLGQQAVGHRLDLDEPLFRHQLVRRDPAADERRRLVVQRLVTPMSDARRSAAPTASIRFRHRSPRSSTCRPRAAAAPGLPAEPVVRRVAAPGARPAGCGSAAGDRSTPRPRVAR